MPRPARSLRSFPTQPRAAHWSLPLRLRWITADTAWGTDDPASAPGDRGRAVRRRRLRSAVPADLRDDHDGARRSEEHTSELQSLMRNSYAVFFLKKT